MYDKMITMGEVTDNGRKFWLWIVFEQIEGEWDIKARGEAVTYDAASKDAYKAYNE